jgi:hypothetical protein
MPGTSGRQDQFSKQSKVGSISQAYPNGRSNLVVNIPLAVCPNEDRASAQVPCWVVNRRVKD